MNAGHAPIRSLRHAALLILAILAPGMAGAEPVEIVEADEVFKSKGQNIKVDVFSPREPGKYPAVLVLHGHGGVPDEGKRSGTHALARFLAESGYVALVPHYFGGLKPSKDIWKNARGFATWERRVSLIVGYAARRSDVDPRRIGVLGTSLGSFVSLSVAARDRRVSAVVEYVGGWPEWESLDPTRLPPVLILHGDADRVVPVEKAYRLEKIFQEAKVPYEMHIYPGAGHGFRGDDHEDARKRTLAFFDTHVKREARPAPADRKPE
jgi:carboxymethylenebutenolidase